MEDIVIFAKRTRLLSVALGCAVFEAFFVYYFVHGLPEGRGPFQSFMPVAAAVGAPMFGAILIYLCYRLVRPRPVVVINREGLFDNASLLSAGLIHWHEIRTMFVYRVMDQPLLGIVPFNAGVIVARQSPVKKLFLRMQNSSGVPPFSIPGVVLPMPPEELLAMIRRYHEKLLPSSETALKD